MQIIADYSYHRPSDIEEAWELVSEDAVIMAGGSDVMPQLKMATIDPKVMIDLAKIEELKKIEEQEDGIHVGAMVTLVHLAKDPMILAKAPILSQAARNVASPQIRNRGTIAGNVMQARRCFYYNQTKEWRQGIPRCRKVGGDICLQIQSSPVCRAIYYSDMAPALIACQAMVKVREAEGERWMSCEELAARHCEDRDPLMLMEEFLIPKASYEGCAARFCKYSLRGSIDFPIVNFACVVKPDQVRFTVGAIATHVIRLETVEMYIAEKRADFDPAEAGELAFAEMKKKCQLIREAGLSVSVKRSSFLQVHEILEEIHRQMNQA